MQIKMIFSILISFGISVILCPILIPFLKRLKFGQNVREEGPKGHLKKMGTPTMGGVMMVAGVVISMIIGFTYAFFTNGGYALEMKDPKKLSMLIAGLLMALCMCAIGFFDDYI